MTARTDGTVRFSARDWIALLVIICGALAAGFKMYIDVLDGLAANRTEMREMRAEWNVQAPAPAKWTVERINDHEKRITLLEKSRE